MAIQPPQKTHDLRLPAWGPYTKKYIGISHVADKKRGLRFDLSVFPGFYRRRVDIPNVNWESGYHPWETAPDFSYFSHRHELEWKDEVYCDVSFSSFSDTARIIRCECVNNTDLPQTLVLHYMASLQFPTERPPTTVTLPEGAGWINALDYSELSFAQPRPADTLVYNGLWRGETRAADFVDGNGLGTGFGQNAGDNVTYSLQLNRTMASATMVLRYRFRKGGACALRLTGPIDTALELTGKAGECKEHRISLGDLQPGATRISFTSLGGDAVEIDGFAVVEENQASAVAFPQGKWKPEPAIKKGPTAQSLTLQYPDLDYAYGLWWDFPDADVRQFLGDSLDVVMRRMVHIHTKSVFKGEGLGHYTNVFMRPIEVAPHSSRIIEGLVCFGQEHEVRSQLTQVPSAEKRARTVESVRSGLAQRSSAAAGRPLQFSQDRMAATLLSNVVFPIYTRGENIKHHTPGRWWDSLYTWDSGFIGLGLLELDLQRAVDSLNAYLTEAGDEHAAFIHHGSPVPVQAYLFQEIWNKSQSRELLSYFYPRIRQMHRFLCGRYGSSTTNELTSHLLKTWDYFYNSGGWDDYPPQVYVHENGLEDSVAPVVNTAHAIRTAKILRLAALELGIQEDLAEYDQDIATFGAALQQHAWDEEAGFFSYVCHDAAGRPTGFLRHHSGVNFDMGLDGASPLIAGSCTPEQATRLIEALMKPGRLWTPIGLSTVDQTAPYYKHDGYWNGAVWMPHQWFFWKALLDLGELELAYRIASTALQLWETEVEATYNCYEHFVVETGRGAGWHQFGGLSAPVLAWFGAYHTPGRITAGFDTWVKEKSFSADKTELTAVLQVQGSPGASTGLVVTMNEGRNYTASWQGEPLPVQTILPGVLHLKIPAQSSGVLRCRLKK